MSASNIDPTAADTQSTAAHQQAAQLVINSVAAVIDEAKRRGASDISLDDLTDRLVMQWNSVPGFVAEDFRARVNASATIASLEAASHPDRGTGKLDAAARKAEDKHRKSA